MGDVAKIRIGERDTREVVVKATTHGWIQVAMMMLGGARLIWLDERKRRRRRNVEINELRHNAVELGRG